MPTTSPFHLPFARLDVMTQRQEQQPCHRTPFENSATQGLAPSAAGFLNRHQSPPQAAHRTFLAAPCSLVLAQAVGPSTHPVDFSPPFVYPFQRSMSLFDLLSKEGRKAGSLRRNLDKALNKDAQSPDRMRALEIL